MISETLRFTFRRDQNLHAINKVTEAHLIIGNKIIMTKIMLEWTGLIYEVAAFLFFMFKINLLLT